MSKYQYPPLKDEKEFESLVNDLCKKEYNNSNFQLYGRKGQKQYGIDGIVLDGETKLIVHQCKNKLISNNDANVRKDLLKEIDVEVKAFNEEFILEKNLKCDIFIFANSWKQDTELQNKSLELSRKYDFNIIVWSWNEIEDRLECYQEIAKQYYPEFYDKSLLSIDDIKGKFIQNSSTLLSARNLFIQNSFIDMKELDILYEFAVSENTDENLLILTGKAGIGKTAILSELQNKLKDENLTYLSIKSDRINVKTKQALAEYFELENLINSVKKIAREETVTIIIDQLDALSLTQSSSKDVFNVILELIQQLKGEFNIKIIISVREYDLKNDPLLKQIDNNKKLYLQLFTGEFVSEKLRAMMSRKTKISRTLIELLRTPLNLSLFLELYPNDNRCLSIRTLQDLYENFWEQKVLDRKLDKDLRKNTIKLINFIVERMNMDKKIEVAKIYYIDEYSEEINLLLSKNILIEEKNRLSGSVSYFV